MLVYGRVVRGEEFDRLREEVKKTFESLTLSIEDLQELIRRLELKEET